jgi:hypothetical protein
MPSRQLLSTILMLIFWGISLNLSLHAQGPENSTPVLAEPSPAQGQQAQTQVNEQSVASETLMEKTADGLKWFFTVLVYPAIVGSIFLLLIGSIIYIISKGKGFGSIRRLTGALLPLLLLTFMLLVTDKGDDPIKSVFLNRNPFIYLFLGILIGIVLVELGKRLIKTDDDRWGSIYNLFLSSMVVFLLYSIMKGFLDSLIYFLFSMIMAGGLDIVFGAPMESKIEITSPGISSTERTEVIRVSGQSERAVKSESPKDPLGSLMLERELRERRKSEKDKS